MRRLLLILLGLVLAVTGSGFTPGAPTASAPASRSAAAEEAKRPNIVFVLMDDASLDLLKYMRETTRLGRDGATFDHAFVADSLCCPSRAATFLGRYSHQTKVYGNVRGGAGVPRGGFRAFQHWKGPQQAFNVSLKRAGYTTGFMGKYMNSYSTPRDEQSGSAKLPAVPGWDHFEEFSAGGSSGWGFRRSKIDRRGTISYGDYLKTPPVKADRKTKDAAYATNVMSADALDFVREQESSGKPYFLELSTYGPHSRRNNDRDGWPGEPEEPSAKYDRPGAKVKSGNCGIKACGSVEISDLVGFDDPRGDNTPFDRKGNRWVKAKPWRTNPLDKRISAYDALRRHRNRIQMVQSVDRMVGRLRAAVGPNTYLVVTSDNGYHLGQHQLNAGKGTPYDSDSHVPLVVFGPDVDRGDRAQFVSNVDLAPTFEELAGARPVAERAGTSFADVLRDKNADGAKYALFEHYYMKMGTGPDAEVARGGTTNLVPSFIAIRSERGVLARFDLDNSWNGTDYAWEAYSYKNLTWEKTNRVRQLWNKPWMKDLRRRLDRFDRCVAERGSSTTDAKAAVCRDQTL